MNFVNFLPGLSGGTMLFSLLAEAKMLIFMEAVKFLDSYF